jgi:hypothetical protein
MAIKHLIAHPATPMPKVKSLGVVLSRSGDGSLQARFDCECEAGALRLPDAQPAAAADELWRHTCCELFAGVAGAAAYREFNWSPSGQWAAYAFSEYRRRDLSTPDLNLHTPRIEFLVSAAGWSLVARLDAGALPGLPGDASAIELGVAAVLEAADGSLSYWALQHAAARPDFHVRDTFALRLSDVAAGRDSKP